jgi:hypothetical protein
MEPNAYTNPRLGWEEMFRKAGPDDLLIPDVFEEEDFSEWTIEEETETQASTLQEKGKDTTT